MNRITGDNDGKKMPEIKGQFQDYEALEFILEYRTDPSDLHCPRCGPKETMEVLAFIQHEIDSEGCATITEPEGEYAAAIYCHKCKRSIGLKMTDMI